MVQDLGGPALEGVAEGADLGHIVALASDDGLAQQGAGFADALGQVDVTDRLLGQPSPEQLVFGIAAAKPQEHALVAAFVEAFGAREQELSDPIERVALAPAVPERLVLDPPAHLVDAPGWRRARHGTDRPRARCGQGGRPCARR